MRRIVRAAGTPAAALLAAAAIFATPSVAVEGETAVATPRYIDHAAAQTQSAPIAVNPLDVPAAEAAAAAQDQLPDHSLPIAPEPAVAAPVLTLAEMVDDFASTEVADAEHECLAGAVYFESKGEPLKGQLTVAEVILNRASSGRFPSTVCGVVKQRGQFSFIRGGRFPAIPRSSAQWKEAVAIAHIARQELAEGSAPKALFFHARHVSPRWKKLVRVATVGNHVFYR